MAGLIGVIGGQQFDVQNVMSLVANMVRPRELPWPAPSGALGDSIVVCKTGSTRWAMGCDHGSSRAAPVAMTWWVPIGVLIV